MLKELIKIQIIAVLIFLMNAIATQNLKFIGKENTSTSKVQRSKEVEKRRPKDINSSALISSINPSQVLLKALKKSLN